MISAFEGFYLGPIEVRWSGLLIALGISLAALLAALEARRRGEDLELIYHLFAPVVLWGLLGARLWHIFTPPLSSVGLGLTTRHYLSNPIEILALWIGGYGVPGMLLGGLFGLFLFSRKYRLPFWALTDLLAPALALGMAVGRIGNFFNQELYGLPVNAYWGIFIQPQYRLAGFEQAEYYLPLFLYEALPNLLLVGVLYWLAYRFRDVLQPGDLLLVYFVMYSPLRFGLEFLKLDISIVGSVNINQVFFAALFVISAGLLFRRHRPAQKL